MATAPAIGVVDTGPQGRSVGDLVREAAMARYGSGGVRERLEAVERRAVSKVAATPRR